MVEKLVQPNLDEQAGSYPYTHGIYPEMYRQRLWTFRQYAGFGTAQETNERFHTLLQQGQTGLSIAFDLPTQMGLDSDHPMAQAEVGRVGVAIDSLQDMEELLQGIPLSKVSISMTINATAIILFAMLQVVAEKQGISPKQLRGTVQNDLLKEYVARGTFIFSLQPSLRLTADLIAQVLQESPHFHPMSVSGYHMREAGCSAVQELAFTFSHALVYLEMMEKRGISMDQFGSCLSFFFASQQNILEEVAKFRAARRIWARLMRDVYQTQTERSWQLRFHTQTAGSALTDQQPQNNIIRVAYQALAAILGGTQSLHTNGWDEAHRLPSAESAVLALRTQQIIAYESGLTDYIDPLAGATLVEEKTHQIERKTWRIVRWIQHLGGAIPLIEKGIVQRAIRQQAYRTQMLLEAGKEKWVGVNCFQDESGSSSTVTPLTHFDIARKQSQKINHLRENRNQAKVSHSLEQIKAVAMSKDSLYPSIIEAVRSHVTVGEICQALKDTWGEEGSYCGKYES